MNKNNFNIELLGVMQLKYCFTGQFVANCDIEIL